MEILQPDPQTRMVRFVTGRDDDAARDAINQLIEDGWRFHDVRNNSHGDGQTMYMAFKLQSAG